MIKLATFVLGILLGTNYAHCTQAVLPIHKSQPLNWGKDIETLRNNGNRGIYAWDILALLTQDALPSCKILQTGYHGPLHSSNASPYERKYALATEGPNSDELLIMLQGIQKAVIVLALDDIDRYLTIRRQSVLDESHKTHIRRIKYLCDYMKAKQLIVSDIVGDVLKKNPNISDADKRFMHIIHTYTQEPSHDNALKESYQKQTFNAIVQDTPAEKTAIMQMLEDSNMHAPLNATVNNVVPSRFASECTYENLMQDPVWTMPSQSTWPSGQQTFSFSHYIKALKPGENWDFSPNANGVYTKRGDQSKIKLIAVFGSLDKFEDPTRHINDYGFLSNYWSTQAYKGQSYAIPAINNATSRIVLTIQTSSKSKRSYHFDHLEGAYHFAKLLLSGYDPNAADFLGKSPYETQQAARGKGPKGKAGEWNKLMFELLKQKFTRDDVLKNKLMDLKGADLVEGNFRGQNTDKNWGVEYDAKAQRTSETLKTGDNKLGRMLQFIAQKLKKDEKEQIYETILEQHLGTSGQLEYRVVPGKSQ